MSDPNQTAWASKVLVDKVLKILVKLLKPGGTFVTKVMRKDPNVFMNFFEEVEFIKPKSSRSDSDEIFVICYDFKGEKMEFMALCF